MAMADPHELYQPVVNVNNKDIVATATSSDQQGVYSGIESDEGGNIATQPLELQLEQDRTELHRNTAFLRFQILGVLCLFLSLTIGGRIRYGMHSNDNGDATSTTNGDSLLSNNISVEVPTLSTTPPTSKLTLDPKPLSTFSPSLHPLPPSVPASATAPIPSENLESLIPEVDNSNSIVDIKQTQIDNYIQGKALIYNIHITHHGGTFVCGVMRKMGPVPDFACMAPYNSMNVNLSVPWPENVPRDANGQIWCDGNVTDNVLVFRPYFHFMTHDYGSAHWGNLHNTDWENENLVSMIVMKDPIERFLSGGKCGRHRTTTPEEWWDYANSKCADNYALRALVDRQDCANGSDTTVDCLENAKAFLRRLTFILDATCLSESMVALGQVLELPITDDIAGVGRHEYQNSTRERINNDTLYEFIKNRFRRDIELYEWSKTQSIIEC